MHLVEDDSLSRDDLKYLIQTCLNLEMDDMACDYVKKLLKPDGTYLNLEERNLFMKAKKGKFNHLRNGWKNLIDFEQSDGESNLIPKNILDSQMENLEKQIKEFCLEIIETIDKLEQNVQEDILASIFYIKVRADYLRYYSEVADENEFAKFVENSEEYYKEAYDKCMTYLEPHNPLTLSVALNFSVFCYFILDDTRRAFNIADNVYRQAISTEHKSNEVQTLIKSIEENLTVWKIELDDN